MIFTQKEINEAEYYGLSVFVKHGKSYLFDNCAICGESFVSEIIKTENGGKRFPRYCEQCVYNKNIKNQNYGKR